MINSEVLNGSVIKNRDKLILEYRRANCTARTVDTFQTSGVIPITFVLMATTFTSAGSWKMPDYGTYAHG